MKTKQQAIIDYIKSGLPSCHAAVSESEQQYHFQIFPLKSAVSHLIIFDKKEFDNAPVAQLVNLMSNHEVTKAMRIAPFALQLMVRENSINASHREPYQRLKSF